MILAPACLISPNAFVGTAFKLFGSSIETCCPAFLKSLTAFSHIVCAQLTIPCPAETAPFTTFSHI
jgi:hypothetical protein